MSTLLLALPTLSYQLSTPPTVRGTAARAALAMEYKLNNYILPGPMTPLANQVLVKLSKTSDVTTGGLFMPSSSTEKPTEGVVVLSGPGSAHPDTGTLMPNPVKEGDLVLLNEYSGEKVDYCGEKHTFVSSDEVLGVFDGGVSAVENFQPLKDRVLVKLEEAASETSSGIALATEGSEEPTQGEVLAVGPGKLTSQGEVVPTGINPGESVIYGRFAATDATISGTTYKVVTAGSCLAKW